MICVPCKTAADKWSTIRQGLITAEMPTDPAALQLTVTESDSLGDEPEFGDPWIAAARNALEQHAEVVQLHNACTGGEAGCGCHHQVRTS